MSDQTTAHDETSVTRSFCVERLLDEETKEKVYRVSLSSETPIKDWPWAPPNVLVHEKAAIDLDGVAERGLPLFVNHDAYSLESMVGRIVNVRLERKRLVGDLRFSQANPEAAMVRDMVDEGTLTDMSIRAEPIKIEKTEGSDGRTESVRWMRWRPIEASVVGIGADRAVGIGRTNKNLSTQTANPAEIKEPKVAEDIAAAGASAERSNGAAQAVVIQAGQQQEHPNAVQMERDRRAFVENMCRANKFEEKYQDHWIRSGLSIKQISDDMLMIMEERGKTNPQSASKLGLSRAETQQFSFLRAIHACAEKDWSKAGFELECSRAVAQKLGRVSEPTKFFVPYEILQREVPTVQRDLTTASPGGGGYLVATENQGFIEILRNRSVAFRMGVRRLTGLQGNVTVPRQSGAATPVWLTTESSTATESTQAFTQMALTPKTVSAYTEISRLLMLQSSPAAEGIVTDDLAQVVAIAADLSVLSGSGASGQPLGITNTSGVGSVSGTSLAYPGILEFQTDVATSNVQPVRGGYVTTPAVAGLLMARARFSNTDTPLWVGNIWDGQMAGFPAMSSNQMATATQVFGDWQEAVVGEWGVLEVDVNPYANFQAGIIGVRALYSLDVGVRRAFAFSVATSIT